MASHTATEYSAPHLRGAGLSPRVQAGRHRRGGGGAKLQPSSDDVAVANCAPRDAADAYRTAAAEPTASAELCSAAAPLEEHYAQSIKILHWVMGAAMLTCMGTVGFAVDDADTQNGTLGEGTKGATKAMMIHKSPAVLVA